MVDALGHPDVYLWTSVHQSASGILHWNCHCACWLILFAAICHLIFAFQPHGVGGFLWQALLAIVYGIAGFYMLMNPLLGVLSLTLVLAGISSLRGNLGDCFLLSYPPGSARRLGFVRRYRYADSRDFNLGPMDHRVPSG